ncbi:DUF4367 domain-containing protein [Crassaminicella indica]|uniref:DUF4367 domain-containing protein n=1 Tax=Crassaminicella indica TaxID=2855394 RepID=A0ABX8RCE9_9CLOT|nr:DUF4367 domain-containing protein [Crassaminicella indica]QXM05600.1 DUF4367 domain-containing protein [Crassaminicella indica]
MKKQKQFEDIIKLELNIRASDITPSLDSFQNIKKRIIEKGRNENNMSKKYNFKNNRFMKTVVAAMLCMTFLTGAYNVSSDMRAFANSIIDKFVKGYASDKTYYKLPEKDELQKELGFEAKVPEALLDDFKFVDGTTSVYVDGSSDEIYDSNRKEFGATYKKASKNSDADLSLTICNYEFDSDTYKNTEKITSANKTFLYKRFKFHIVPSDYKQSQEELEDEKNGYVSTIWIGSKASDFNDKYTDAQALIWQDNNIYYQLIDNGYKLSTEDMIKMAKEIIKMD